MTTHATQPSFALITGATGGIGIELARRLAAEKHGIILVGRSAKKLSDAAHELATKYSVQTHCVAVDLGEPGAVDTVVGEVANLGCTVDVLINNAGFGYDAPFAESDLTRQRALLQVNNMALMELCFAFLPQMCGRGRGEVLNVASVAGFLPGPYLATYYASKAFVQSFSQALRMEVREFGVHVTALCPGPVETKFWKAADADHTALAANTIDAATVARIAVRDLHRNKALSIPGATAKLAIFATRLLPRGALAHASARLQRPRTR